MRRYISFLSLIFLFHLVMSQQETSRKIDVSQSIINWEASKITGSTHTGTLKFLSGEMKFYGWMPLSAEFVVDMTSLDVTDLKGKKKEKLIKHLMDKDFFQINQYKTAMAKIELFYENEKGKLEAQADYYIKGVNSKHKIIFDYIEDGKWMANSTIDRTKHDIRYGSKSYFNIGNRAISDNFDLKVKLVLH